MGAYREPSVNITQVQETVTINAGITDFMAGIIGPSYDLVELNDWQYEWITTSGTTMSITLSGIEANDTAKTIDANSVFVEMVTKTGTIIPFTGTITVNSGGNIITLSSGTQTLAQMLPNMGNGNLLGYRPKVSYRALYKDRYNETFVSTSQDAANSIGKFVIENPLGFASSLMLQNTRGTFMVYPIKSNDAAGYTDARERLENSNVYAFAPLSQDKDSILPSFVAWTKDRSTPEKGHPTKLYMSPKILWYDSTGTVAASRQLGVTPDSKTQTKFSFALDQLGPTGRLRTAQNIAAMNGQILERRVSSIYPDMAWIQLERNVLQCNPAFVAHITDVTGGMAVLARTIVLLDGDILHAGTIIDGTQYLKLVDKTKYADNTVLVWYPVAGSYLAVQQAALVSALNPSEPKTQQPVSGIGKIPYSENFFGKENTNTIAGGGTNVIVQPTLSVLPASRHHMTTDATTTQTREDNIVHQIDIVTINYITALRGLVGRFKQTPKYFKLLRAILTAYAEQFKLKEYIKDLQILEVKEDPNTPDKVLVVLRVTPFYAANYIDVTIFY